jgi:polar amino acid transport system substrate-binding protein
MSQACDSLEVIRTAGVLRIGLFPSFFYARSAAGDYSGWGIEMARALAADLDVDLRLIESPSPPATIDALRAGDCEAAFIGITPERRALLDFSAPWVEGDFTFLVRAGSGVTRIADLDQPDLRIGVVAKHAMDSALDGKLPAARRVYASTPDAAFDLFLNSEIDVLAGIRPGLSVYATRAPGSRVLPDRYGSNIIGLAVRKNDPAWLEHVSTFVASSKSTGRARSAAEKCGALGLEILL